MADHDGWVRSWPAASMGECFFYHAMDLPGLGTVGHEAAWDLRGRFEDYTGHLEVKGRTFLDVGAASGFISFEAEKRGAFVTSFDLDSGARRQLVPKEQDVGDSDQMYREMKNAYWFCHRLLSSRAKTFYGDIYHFPENFGPFDVVFVGQTLVHLRDPIGALMNIASVCGEVLVISEGMFESDRPLLVFLSPPESQNHDAWWHLSTRMYADILNILGFEIRSLTHNRYRTSHPALASDVEIGTIVAKRTRLLVDAASKRVG